MPKGLREPRAFNHKLALVGLHKVRVTPALFHRLTQRGHPLVELTRKPNKIPQVVEMQVSHIYRHILRHFLKRGLGLKLSYHLVPRVSRELERLNVLKRHSSLVLAPELQSTVKL